MADSTPEGKPSTYKQELYGSYSAQAAGPGASASVKVIQLPLPPDADLAAAAALLARVPTDNVAPVTTLPAGSSVPFPPNPLYIGRADELIQLAATFAAWDGASMPAIAVTGIGGVGKSQLAVEFAHRYGCYFAGGVYWLSFGSPGAIAAEIANRCAAMPDLPRGLQEFDLPTQLGMILGAWRSPLPRLLIFDNCEDEALLPAWRPATGGARVLLTSRRDVFHPALGVQVLPLATLLRTDSVTLLRKLMAPPAVVGRRGKVQAAAPPPAQDGVLDDIAAVVGDLPLALHVAGSYLHTYRGVVTPEAYLAQLRSIDPLAHASFAAVAGSTYDTDHDLYLARTFAISYDRLDAANATDRLALDLLARAACFAPGEPIPRDLLTVTLGLPPDDPDAPLQAADAYQRSANLGVLSSSESGDPFLHRLLARFVLSRQSGDTAQEAVEEAVVEEAGCINRDGNPRPLLACRVHLTHIADGALLRGDEPAARLANDLGYHLWMAGDYAGARSYYERSLAIYEQVLGAQHPSTATSLNNLGMLLYTTGDYAGARPYLERSLAICEQVLGAQHPNTAGSLNNLGLLLKAMGDYAGARPYYERSLAIREQVLGAQHPDTATSLNSLGGLLQAMGDYAGARPYYERSLAIYEQVLGAQHPSTANSLDSLGSLLQDMGDYAGARPYYEQSLAIYEQVLGEQHPSTATSLNNLGVLLQAMGDYAGARSYYERSLAIRQQVLGEQHPSTATSLNNLGMLLHTTGDYAGARPYLERAWQCLVAALGADHPNTQMVRHNLDALPRNSTKMINRRSRLAHVPAGRTGDVHRSSVP